MLQRLRDWLAAPAGESPAARTSSKASVRTAAQRRGDAAEELALAHLQDAGLTLVERNFLARGGEIDLVMREGAVLVFVEVRHRSDAGHGDGLASVGPRKQRRLLAAARHYLAQHPQAARDLLRFDIVSSGAGGLRWVRDAIRVDEGGW
ncbi:MAG: YraN family protein [Xanthomonadales bacterium]|nr:YraN family protein [Xanthomonadales bacterium]